MTWLRFSALALVLSVGCDKTVPFENTSPIKMGQTTVSNMDAGSFVLLDASFEPPSDGAIVPEIPAEAFSKPELLRQIADCTVGRYREFNDLAAALQLAVAAWQSTPSTETLGAAQLAWRKAMSSWEQAELFAFGPEGPSTTSTESDPGGQDFRNEIYFFPNINLCLVDQALFKASSGKFVTPSDQSSKGLGALEYLLFYSGANNACAATLAINTGTPSPWSKISADDLALRRAGLANALASSLASSAKMLLDAWDPSSSASFYSKFTSAGMSGSPYDTDQAAFNSVNIAMFYVGKQLKDSKLGTPAGVLSDCSTGTCPERVESLYSQQSNDDIVQNLQGFRLLFQGCGGHYTGLGFDDWLAATNQADLANRIIAATEQAQQAAVSLQLPLEQEIRTNNQVVLNLHADILNLYNILKGEFLSALNFELPAAAAGDND